MSLKSPVRVLLPWIEHPFRLISWIDMLKFSAIRFYLIGEAICGMLEGIKREPIAVISERDREMLTTIAERIKGECEAINLTLSLISVNDLLGQIKTAQKMEDLNRILDHLDCRIRDEIAANLFLWIPTSRSRFFEYPKEPEKYDADQKSLTGLIADRFRKASNEINEARTCFALGRNTACIFHLMRACEVGIKAVYKTLGVASPKLPDSWGLMLKPMDEQLQKKPADRYGDWAKHPEFFDHATNDLRAIKRTWRDTTMHVESDYSESEASRALTAVTSFFEHLSAKLDQDGKFHT